MEGISRNGRVGATLKRLKPGKPPTIITAEEKARLKAALAKFRERPRAPRRFATLKKGVLTEGDIQRRRGRLTEGDIRRRRGGHMFEAVRRLGRQLRK